MNWIVIQYKQGMKFELDMGYPLPTQIPVNLANGVYTLKVPDYCVDGNGKINNTIMWSLYPQYSSYDFASGQV